MKMIAYRMPVDYMRGNISGRQVLEYGQNDGEAYDQPSGQVTAANNYKPRLIAKVLRAPYVNRLRYFQVRTKSSVNMTAAYRHNVALMGGVGSIFAAVISDKTAQLYINCVHACPKGKTLRGWMVPILRQGLAAKNSTLVISGGIAINNPWISGGTGVTVNIPQTIVDKFTTELSN